MIRAATATDIPVLARLHASAFAFPAEYWNAAMLQESLAHAATLALATWHENEPSAFLLFRNVADIAEILTLATAPAHQRKGYASVLLQETCAFAQTRGATAMLLDVAADNAPALALYMKHGFSENGRRKGYYTRPGERVDALLMRKILSS